MNYTFGPGPLSTAIKAIIWANVGMFLLTTFVPPLVIYLGLTPAAFFQELWIWQPITYLFLHGDLFHLLFNMLALWMFGVELERLWGTRFFVRYYLVTGIGAAATTLLSALLSDRIYYAVTIGASGSVYGLLLAFALYYPNRPIYLYFLFPVPAKIFVMIIGGIVFLSSISDTRGGVAHAAHLGGLVCGYLYLKGGIRHMFADVKYHYLRWKTGRMRRRFEIKSGGRSTDWDRRVH